MPTRQGNWLHKHSGAYLALHLFAKGIFLEISYVGWFGAETLRWPIFPLLNGSVDRSVYRWFWAVRVLFSVRPVGSCVAHSGTTCWSSGSHKYRVVLWSAAIFLSRFKINRIVSSWIKTFLKIAARLVVSVLYILFLNGRISTHECISIETDVCEIRYYLLIGKIMSVATVTCFANCGIPSRTCWRHDLKRLDFGV